MTELERLELVCRRAKASLGPMEFDEKRVFEVLIRELEKTNKEMAEGFQSGPHRSHRDGWPKY